MVESNQPSQNQHLYEQVTPTSPNTAYRPLYTNSNTQPISNQIVRSSNSSASHTSTYVSHENNFSRAHLDRQPTDQIPQIHAATDGNTTPTLFHETSTAKAYQESSSLDHKSVPSSIKTKQTSTQADFYSADQHKEASSLPATEDIQPLLKSDFEVPHQFNVNALPRSQNANGYAGALSVPRLLHDAERSQSSQVPQTTFTDGRFLEDSKKISNTTWQSEQFRTEPRTQHQHMPQFQQNSTLQESMLNGIPITQDSSLAKLAPSSTSERARTPDRPTSRPFSFMEMSPDQRIKPEEELLNRAPSMESTSNHGRLDRPPSPVSPQRSMTRDLSDQQSRSIPTHHDTSHDFSVSDDQQRLRNRPRSFSRPFREPDLHEHPAFRQEEERQEVAAERRYTSAPYEQARLPRQQTTEYQLEGVGPPTTTQRSDSNAKSRRASRSSAFFKNLTNPARVEGPPLSIEPEAQHTESSSRNPVSGEVKNKRASIFRSTNERRGSTREKSTGAVDTPTPAPPTDLPRKMSTTKPRNSEIDKTVKAGSSKVRSKLQRATTSAAAEQDAGKKKRFSALGVSLSRAISTNKTNITLRASLVDQSRRSLAQRPKFSSHQPLYWIHLLLVNLRHPTRQPNIRHLLVMIIVNTLQHRNIMRDHLLEAITLLIIQASVPQAQGYSKPDLRIRVLRNRLLIFKILRCGKTMLLDHKPRVLRQHALLQTLRKASEALLTQAPTEALDTHLIHPKPFKPIGLAKTTIFRARPGQHQQTKTPDPDEPGTPSLQVRTRSVILRLQ